MEGDPACAGEALLPSLREDYPAAGTIASGGAWAAGPGLLAHILFRKYGLHLPLTRQNTTCAREGIELGVSTLADWVGASAATLMTSKAQCRRTASAYGRSAVNLWSTSWGAGCTSSTAASRRAARSARPSPKV